MNYQRNMMLRAHFVIDLFISKISKVSTILDFVRGASALRSTVRTSAAFGFVEKNWDTCLCPRSRWPFGFLKCG